MLILKTKGQRWKKILFVSYVFGATILTACLQGPFFRAVDAVPIGGRLKTPMRAIMDSPEVRKIIREEEGRQGTIDQRFREIHTRDELRALAKDRNSHPDQWSPGHKEFVKAMNQAPSITVPGKTRARVLEFSKARCLPDDFSTVTFVRMVIVGKQPPAGSEVWVCTYPYAMYAP